MIEIGDRVNRKGGINPTGIVEKVIGKHAVVRWGIADGRKYSETIPLDQLKIAAPLEHRNIFDNKEGNS